MPEQNGFGHYGVLQGSADDDLPSARMLFELLMLGLAAIHGVVAWWLLRGKPAAAALPAAARTQARAASHAPTLERAS